MSLIPVVIALLMNLVIGPLAPVLNAGPQTLVSADDVEIVQDTTVNGCNGVVTTPGSENTDKRLIAGSLEPGGTATFEISYPVDPDDVAGREEFEITDCVFIEDVAVAKYFIHFVPNTENFLLTFTLEIPDNAPVGDEYCNYAKTTAAPSQSQASNRKAGPACFLIGGDLLIHKTDASGAPLAGATFSIACTWPTTTADLAGTVITASPDGSVSDGNDANGTNDSSEAFTSTSGGTLNRSATTGSNGTIGVAAPVGTSCTFTETAPPPGYEADPNDLSETLVVTSGQQQEHTFVNTLPPTHLTIVKDLTGEVPGSDWAYTGDLGAFTLPAAGGSTSAFELQAGTYTVSETTKENYDVSVTCDNGDSGTASVDVTLDPGDDVTCTFFNVAQPGSITIIKALDGDAPASAWGYTGDLGAFSLPAGGGQQTFSDLAAGQYDVAESTKVGYTATVSCTSGESGSSSVSIDLDPGENVTCTFDNVADTSVTIDKSNDAEAGGEPGAVSRGDTVHFVIEVNIDGNDASSVVVTDTLPDGLTYVADSADPSTTSVAGQVLTWDMGDLAQGQYVFSYDATVDGDATGTLTNVGCIETDELAEELCDDSSVLVNEPVVTIDKVNNSEDPVTRGSTVHYTLTVTVADGPAHDVIVTDELPTGISYKVDTADPSAGFSLSLDGRTLTWDAGTLANGTHTFEYDGLVANDAPINANITNVGCVAASDDDTDEPICDDSTVTVTPPSITIDKSNEFEGESVVRGETIDYSITVEVVDGPMQNAVVTDTLPDGLTYVADSGSPEPTSVIGSVITWEIGAMATGEHTFTYQVTVDEDAAGELTNLACVDTDELDDELCDQTTVGVTPPSVHIMKDNNTEGPVARGSLVDYTLTVTVQDGPIASATVTDTLPDGLTYVVDSADPSAGFVADGQELTWVTGPLASGSYAFTYQALVDGDAEIGTELINTGCVTSDDDAEDGLICDDSEIEVIPATIAFDKSSTFEGESVLRGQAIDYTLEVTVINGPIHDAVVFDSLPDGLTYVSDSADPDTGFANAGQELVWAVGTLDSGTYEFTYSATVDADASGELANLACVDADEADNEVCDQTTVEVRVPTLLVDKSASTDTITISGPSDELVADPEIVTWTLTWTLTDGPVTNATISDEIPAGFEFLDASDGGLLIGGEVVWTFATLSESGSVTFRTTVDPETISRVAPTVNVAVIDSDETEPDEGEDSVTVVVEPPVLGGTPTPRPSLPNTASGFGTDGTPVTIPVELLVAFFLGSLGALALANVKARSRRR
ncbi:MAG TPA: isopeptide-forming domain-containing fimbrial protein [Candidatus Limnocylindria bacterium]